MQILICATWRLLFISCENGKKCVCNWKLALSSSVIVFQACFSCCFVVEEINRRLYFRNLLPIIWHVRNISYSLYIFLLVKSSSLRLRWFPLCCICNYFRVFCSKYADHLQPRRRNVVISPLNRLVLSDSDIIDGSEKCIRPPLQSMNFPWLHPPAISLRQTIQGCLSV